MAVINCYDTPVSKKPSVIKTKKGVSVKEAISTYIEDKQDKQTIEVYNTETGETYKKELTIEKYKAVIIVNGEEKDLDYIPKSKDIVSVIFFPLANANGADIGAIIGAGFLVVIGALLMWAGGAGAIFEGVAATIFSQIGTSLVIGGAIGLVAGTVNALTKTKQSDSKKEEDADKEKSLTIKGAENQLIKGSRFPWVMGKISTNPYIMGSPYHETFVNSNGKFDAQYFNCLYCVGYGPLKLTDFKIGNTILTYNKPRADVSGEQNNPTLMHGHIDYSDSSTVIPSKWKNNDIKLEILQHSIAGAQLLSDSEVYGSLYNKTIIEDQIDANLLFIFDKEISEAIKTNYKNVEIPSGFRTNTVRLSQDCPYKIEVELDFPSGLYRTRTKTENNVSNQKYYDIPVRYAVQWRYVKNTNKSSDPETDASSWNTFDYMDFHWHDDNGVLQTSHQTPSPYTLKDSITDMSLNLGASLPEDGIKNGLRNYALEVKYDEIYEEARTRAGVDSQYSRAVINPSSGTSSPYYTPAQEEAIVTRASVVQTDKIIEEWIDVNDWSKINEAIDAGYFPEGIYNQTWFGTDVFCINPQDTYATEISPKDFNANERHYVFTKNFTPEEAQRLIGRNGYSDKDFIEVRVIRLTPCYIDQSGSNDKTYGDFSYQDLGQWSYMRTFVFDKEKYQEAIATDSTAIPSDYPLRPFTKSDAEKFCFVALRLKQDVAETGGSSLKKFRVTAEQFAPKYNSTQNQWFPNEVRTIMGYYQKTKVSDKWQINELTKAQYEQKITLHESGLFTKSKGNDFIPQVTSDIFTSGAVIGTASGMTNYKLLPEVESKYVDNNVACSALLALVGPQNGIDAKGYDSINMTSATELYKFCEDVTDGSPVSSTDSSLLHMKFTCNGVVAQDVKLEQLIQKILLTGRSVIKRDDWNRYEFLIGRPEKYPVAILNSKTVITKSNTRAFQDSPSGLQLQLQDEDDDYNVNTIYAMDDGEDWRAPKKEIEGLSIQYVTNKNQMWSLGRYNLAARLFQREVYTRTVGQFGLTLSIGNLVLLQDDSLLVGTDHGGRITKLIEHDGLIYGVYSNEPFEYTGELDGEGKCVQGVTILQPNKYGCSRCVTLRLATPEGNGYITSDAWKIGLTNIVAFANPIQVTPDGNISDDSFNENGEFCTLDPKEGDVLAFGKISSITEKAIITGIKPSKNNYALTLVPYNEEFYNYGKEIPDFKPDMTVPDREAEITEFTPYAKKADITASKTNTQENENNLSVDTKTYVHITECVASRDGITARCEVRQNENILVAKSVIWKIYREDFTYDYEVADPQPASQSDIDSGTFYIKNGTEYEKAVTYESGLIYYEQTCTEEDTLVRTITTQEPILSYVFDRSKGVNTLNGYPEYYHFYNFKITATATLTSVTTTPESFYSRINTDSYGTWLPSKPIIDVSVQDRNAVLSFKTGSIYSNKSLYGAEALKFRVRIKRLMEGDSEEFAKPELSRNAYPVWENNVLTERNETSYRTFVRSSPRPSSSTFVADKYYKQVSPLDYELANTYETGVEYYEVDYGYYISDGKFVQTLPLKGQSDKNSVATNYMYEVSAVTEFGFVTETTTVNVQALITNIRDIVRANADEKIKYVEELSAITANLGEITDGSLAGNETNYWTLTTKENPQPDMEGKNRDYQGAFSVGDDNQYFRVVPQVDGAHQITGYEIKMKIGNFEASAETTSMSNNIYLYDDNDYSAHGHEGIEPYHTKRSVLSATGIVMETNSGTADEGPDANWQRNGQVTLDSNGNMFITNTDDPTNLPQVAFNIPNSINYHFKTDTLDENGGNGASITTTGYIASDQEILFNESNCLLGTVQKSSNITTKLGFFVKDGKTTIGGDYISLTDNGLQDYKALDQSTWGKTGINFILQ